jgi:hypothetical protein
MADPSRIFIHDRLHRRRAHVPPGGRRGCWLRPGCRAGMVGGVTGPAAEGLRVWLGAGSRAGADGDRGRVRRPGGPGVDAAGWFQPWPCRTGAVPERRTVFIKAASRCIRHYSAERPVLFRDLILSVAGIGSISAGLRAHSPAQVSAAADRRVLIINMRRGRSGERTTLPRRARLYLRRRVGECRVVGFPGTMAEQLWTAKTGARACAAVGPDARAGAGGAETSARIQHRDPLRPAFSRCQPDTPAPGHCLQSPAAPTANLQVSVEMRTSGPGWATMQRVSRRCSSVGRAAVL